jgi:hypothetical protein
MLPIPPQKVKRLTRKSTLTKNASLGGLHFKNLAVAHSKTCHI